MQIKPRLIHNVIILDKMRTNSFEAALLRLLSHVVTLCLTDWTPIILMPGHEGQGWCNLQARVGDAGY